MATLAVDISSRAGGQLTGAAASGGGDDFPNDGRTVLIVQNGGGSACDITFDYPVDPNTSEPTQSSSATTISVPAGEDHSIGPFPTSKWPDSVGITYNQVATVTVSALSVS